MNNKAIILVILLFSIRLLLFLFGFSNNFDNLWRPGSYYFNFPTTIYVLLIGLLIYTFYIYIKRLKNTDNKIKNSLCGYFFISYFFLSLFNRFFIKKHFTYLYLLLNSNTKIADIAPCFTLDLIYEPPYILWSLLFMGIIYFVCKKYNKIEYSIPFWVIPLLFIDFITNDIITVALFSNLIIALMGMKFSKRFSAFPLLIFQFVIDIFCAFLAYKSYYTNPAYLTIAITTIALFYIPSFCFSFICIKTKDERNISLTWILPFTTLFFSLLPLLRLPSYYNLVSIISMINTFILFGNLSLVVIIIFIVYLITNKINKKFSEILFGLMSVVAILFYLLDSVLFYYSHFRLNYETILWAVSMNDFISTTLKTCLDYISPIYILGLLLISVFIVILCKMAVSQRKPYIRFAILLILIISQSSIALLQLTDPIPYVLRDPFFEFVKSIPTYDYSLNNYNIDEIKEGFKECNIDLKHYQEKDVNPELINRMNVILITLESVHWRYLNIFGKEPKTWPLMSKLKDRMEIFPLFFSCFPESTSGDYALATSLVPYDYLFLHKNPNKIHKSSIQDLIKYNYDTYMFSSENINDGGLSNLIKSIPFNYIFEYNSFENKHPENSWIWGYKEEYTTKSIVDYLSSRKTNKPYFLWYRTVYPHSPFTNLDSDKNMVFNEKNEYGELTLLSKYKNALIYLDKALYNFINNITELDKKTNQQTLIVMVGDHGEMLGERDNYGLTSHLLYTTPQIQNVPCIFIKPTNSGFKINNNYGSQIDVMPTVFDFIKLKPSIERYEQGESLYSENLASRSIYLTSAQSYALVEDGYFYEFRDKNNSYAKVTQLFISEDFNQRYKTVFEGTNEDIVNKYNRTKRFFKLQEKFLINQK